MNLDEWKIVGVKYIDMENLSAQWFRREKTFYRTIKERSKIWNPVKDDMNEDNCRLNPLESSKFTLVYSMAEENTWPEERFSSI